MNTFAGLLPDHEILLRGAKLIDPFDPRRVQPASYDLTLHPVILVPKPDPLGPVDLRVDDLQPMMETIDITTGGVRLPHGDLGFILQPGRCFLASTAERIRIPADIAARVEGKSSLGRLFVAIHVTAGWIDPGWQGQVTLEVVNHGPWPVAFYPGMKIAQVNFTQMALPCAVPYGSEQLGSHYQGQEGPRVAAGRRGRDGAG